jgi:hypothetical protein
VTHNRIPPMFDPRESPFAKLLEPNIRSSIETAAIELGGLVRIVKLGHNLDDVTLDKLAWRGDVLLDRIVKDRALSLGDVLLKLELWRRLPADLWDSARIIESVTTDLEELSDRGAIRAAGAWPRTTAPAHGVVTLINLVLRIARRLIERPAHAMRGRTRTLPDYRMPNDIGLNGMDVEREVPKP